MALELSGSINISGSMTATTIVVSSPGVAGMVSSSAQITELAPLMAYTASLKGAAIVSSSQQITNYYKFAETASANTFYGTQTISGDIKAISNTGSTLKSVQLGTAVNGTGGGNRGFDGSFTGTTTSFIGVDAVDQGYGYFPATIVNGNTYTLFFKSVETNGTLGTIITSNGTNFATSTVQTLTLPSVTNGVYNTVTFTASASATHIGFAGYPTTGTITLTISEVSLVDGIADANIGKLIVQRSLVASGDSMFNGNQSITGSLRVTGSLKVGDWQHGEGLANNAKLDIRTGPDRGLKVTGAASADVIITAYRGASDDMVRSMRLEGNAINIYIGDGNANTGSSVASFNTNGLGFESGKGIDFSATSNGSGTTGSELLNDYEEGTFTPTLGGTSTYTTQFGNYTKIGNKVFFKIFLTVNLIGTCDEQNIYGLPFNCDSTTTGYSIYVGAFQDLSSAKVFMAGRVGLSGTTIAIRSMAAAAVGVAAANVFQNGSTIELSGFYGV